MLVEAKSIRIGTVDFTSFFTQVGYQVEYIKRLGNQGGLLQDGSMEEDLLDRKAVVTLPCYPLNEDQISELLSALFEDHYPAVEYYDPWMKDYRRVYAIVDTSRLSYRGHGADGNSYWTGSVVKLTEK